MLLEKFEPNLTANSVILSDAKNEIKLIWHRF